MPDQLVTGGDILTMAGGPSPEAIAVRGGRIAAVGSRDHCAGVLGARYDTVELGGATLLPGFVDAHCHPLMLGQSQTWVDCTPERAPSIDDIVGALGHRAGLRPGAPVRGFGYHQGRLSDGRHPDRHDLDRVTVEQPVMLMHASGHGIVVNSHLLDAIGVDDAMPDPPGGVIHRDAAGHATGLLWDAATDLITGEGGVKITNHGPNFHLPEPMADLLEALDLAQELFLAKGVTSVCDAQVSQREMTVWLAARDTGRLRVRAGMLVLSSLLDEVLRLGLHSTLGDDQLAFLGIKCYSDGSLTSYNAAIDAGYAFDPCHHGHEYHAPEELADLIGRAHAAGLQTGTHAQGDRAIRVALDAIELAQASAPRPDARHRIEHCGLPGAANIARMAALGAVAVNQPQHHYLYGEAVAAAVGPAGRNYNPLGSLRRAGVAIALSSDAPVAPPDPLRAISTAVTRRTVSGAVLGDPGEALTVEQALAAHTIGAARAMRREAAIGSIEPGKLADLVVLDRNPLRCDPDELPGLAVSRLPAVAP